MRTVALVTLAVAILLLPGEAAAVTVESRVTRESAKSEGFDVAVVRGAGGTVQVTVTRVRKARSFPEGSKVQTVRTATLEVRGAAGFIAMCKLEFTGDGAVADVYRFDLAPAAAAHSRVVLTENYMEGGLYLIGGGTIHRLRVDDFLR